MGSRCGVIGPNTPLTFLAASVAMSCRRGRSPLPARASLTNANIRWNPVATRLSLSRLTLHKASRPLRSISLSLHSLLVSERNFSLPITLCISTCLSERLSLRGDCRSLGNPTHHFLLFRFPCIVIEGGFAWRWGAADGRISNT
jgi:hypothetical protein